LAGLQSERLHNVDLLGVGLHVNLNAADAPAPLDKQITSLRIIARRRSMDMNDVLIALSHHLRQMLDRRHEHSFAGFLHEYDAHHALLGRQVTVVNEGEPPVSGRCEGLDPTGRLLLRKGKALHRIISGQVAMRP
jgi:biotin-(acetyl-CoA carboxylase) ligase